MDDFDSIRNLRAQCGASIGSCKKALEEAGGDMVKALEILRREGVVIAEKKSSRATNAGIVDAYVHGGHLGVLVAVKCETDFVARNEDFRAFTHDLAMHVAAAAPADVSELLNQPFIKDSSKTVGDCVKATIAKFGENVEIQRFVRLEL